ncbi:hypothetical protein VTN00DRAFT_8283 [Thermoascus crustaceus]|uniref:uncharacterized protein n=1 Tax=Thermoascus crustaceus TaxID=5088 RepID=UPI003744878E
MLPEDAYALLFLVNYDLFEDDDNTFVCGRAYGGSRVAVVSSARYSPDLDGIQSVERQHVWPASHCENYMSACCKSSQGGTMQKQRKYKDAEESKNGQPVQNAPLALLKAALSASYTLPDVDSSPPSLLSALWLGRVCRTASHELGHCFGIEHCVYYACVMQGSASLSEDARQPPYLCPVDLAKILCATGMTASQRYLALLAHCERPYNKGTHFFSTFAAWIHSRLKEMGDGGIPQLRLEFSKPGFTCYGQSVMLHT